MEKINIISASGQLVNALANMGYEHEAAICNLIDNSIDADASSVKIHLPSIPKKIGWKPTVYQYIIADDGCGMNRDTLITAFTLGSEREYPKYALGKFGIGLKSAGLSLGYKIVVVTKTEDMDKPLCGILSRQEIEASGNYTIDLGKAPIPYDDLWEKYAPNESRGTVVLIEELNSPPFQDFIEYLQRYCGIVYHLFLEDQSKPLSIIIENSEVKPIDPLFLKEAEKTEDSLNPETWDGRTLHVLLKSQPLVLNGSTECEIAATHLINPYIFQEEGKQEEMRDKYCIGQDPYTKRSRHGFYVYRNRRVIVMAELFLGIVSRENRSWAFKGRLMFNESADAVLSLDVKKRHCKLPSEARANLQEIIRPIHTKSTNAWREAGSKTKKQVAEKKEDIAQQSITKTPVADLDYSPGTPLESTEAIQKRKKRQEEVRKDSLKNIQDPAITEETLEQKAKDKDVVVHVEGLRGNRMWQVYPATTIGLSETLVNEHHSWVKTAYDEAENDPRITIILHQLFTILAKAELEIKTHEWDGISPNVAEKVFDLFRRKASAIGEDLAETLKNELGKFTLPQEEKE